MHTGHCDIKLHQFLIGREDGEDSVMRNMKRGIWQTNVEEKKIPRCLHTSSTYELVWDHKFYDPFMTLYQKRCSGTFLLPNQALIIQHIIYTLYILYTVL